MITADDFRPFLCHLYFASHYCYPPFLPKTDINLDTSPSPLSLTFPDVPSIDWSDESTQLRFIADSDRFVRNEALLTLAYYFDCAALMRQCETILMTKATYGHMNEDSA